MQQDLVQMYDPRWQWSQLNSELTPGDHDPLLAAFELAARIHHNQWRKTAQGKPAAPYMVHPVRVARILLEEWGLRDRKVIATALLHDVLEDCPVSQRDETARQVAQIAGQEVFQAVDALTKSPLPPDVPEERVKALRKAFLDAVRSAAFQADFEEANGEPAVPESGEEILALIKRLYASPPALIARIAKAIEN